MKEVKKSKKKKNIKRIYIIIAICIVIILLILFGAKLYLYVRALLGNDLILKITAEKENLFLKYQESDTVKIKSYAITNLFCDTVCNSKFIDLSSGITLNEETFKLKLSKTSDFNLTANDFGTGQKIYRYDLECSSIPSILCVTKGEKKKRSILITLNYEPSLEEKNLENILKPSIEKMISNINYYTYIIISYNKSLNTVNNSLDMTYINDEINSKLNILNFLNESSSNLIDIWQTENYSLIGEVYNKENSIFLRFASEFNDFNDSFYYTINTYNNLIENLSDAKNTLENYKQLDLTKNSTDELLIMIKNYNNVTLFFNEKNDISKKEAKVFLLLNQTNNFIPEIKKSDDKNTSIFNISDSVNISFLNLSKITIESVNFINYLLNNQYPKCCLYNKCEECCDNRCYNDSSKYPVILLHGHAFNQGVSADASLDNFELIQRELDRNNYLNAGSLLISPYNKNLSGVLGNVNNPITLKASYYFDLLNKGGENVIIETKTDNLNTYTLRLRDIIDAVKYKTNRNKVTLVGHSMAGLIIRRYIQIFGEEDIDRVILIDVPNLGISGRTLQLCPVFGTKLECADMDKNSLFMSKLNSAPIPTIPFYNIIGVGCQNLENTNNENGDGIVGNSSQYLEYATNYYVNGSCKESEFRYLHVEILNPAKYPKAYNIIKNSLE